jgi:enoyl-CoA hydratase
MSTVKVSQADGIVSLTLDRPQALNALDPATLGALEEALRGVAADGSVRAVVLTGAGEKAFCAGADIAAMQGMAPGDGHAFARLGHAVTAQMEALPAPVIAAVNGVALGGGLELALACDLVVASERARLGQPEINLGIIPGFGGTQRLVRRVGLAKARDLVYRGTVIAADEALRIGLVDRVVAPDKVRDDAHALAAELAAKAPLALRAAKRATAAAFEGDPAAGCRYEVEAFAVTFASGDRAEGMKAFLEKRPARWQGR